MRFEKKRKNIRIQQIIAKIFGTVLGVLCRLPTAIMPIHIRVLTRHYIAKKIGEYTVWREGINYVVNGVTPYIRVLCTAEKETETCEWIRSFPQDAVFWDIGANIGIFSLMAAKRNIETYAFEPHPANYLNLVQNIHQNKFADKLSAFPIALHDQTVIAPLYLSDIEVGMAWNSFAADDDNAERLCRIQAIGFSADAFSDQFHVSIPTHIKMDVDGNELKILGGAKKILLNPKLREILIEIDMDEKLGNQHTIEEVLTQAGFYKASLHIHGHRSANVIYKRNES